MQRTQKGTIRRGRQSQRLEDNIIQLMHSFEVNIRISKPEKVMSTEAKKNALIVVLYDTVFLSLII